MDFIPQQLHITLALMPGIKEDGDDGEKADCLQGRAPAVS